MKKILIVLLLSFFSLVELSAQQDPQYTQYMYNMNVLNPAYAGSRGNLTINALGRTQWVGIDGAPNTATFSIHSPLNNDKLGLGFSVIYDEIGPVKETNVYGDFSYSIRTSVEGKLAFGIKAGATFQDLGLVSLLALDQNDVLLEDNVNNVFPNVGAGLLYYTEKFYAGLSVPNLLESDHFEKENGVITRASEKMHYFGTLGYVFDLSESVKLKPSTMVKAAIGAPVSIDLSANVLFNEKVEFGLSHRLDDSISGMIGFNVNPDFRVGYAYDYTLSNLGDYNSGSHELMLLYDFSRKKIKSPRFF